MVGVAVFAVGVLALAKCVDHCLTADAIQRQDQCARLALENRMAEIQAEAVEVKEASQEELDGRFRGITLKQKRTPLVLKNADGTKVLGVYMVQLDAQWKESSIKQNRSLSFYVYRP